ncbi:MAG: hypothetical protein AB1476_01535 [Candidatus Hadarchaeota archaeon]
MRLTPESSRVLARRIKIFVILGALLMALSKLFYLGGVTYPNFELVIPSLVVIGSFSLPLGSSRLGRWLTRYFGLVAMVTVMVIDLVFWGPLPIYIFTWSGLALCWFIGLRNRLSPFDRTSKLLGHTMLTGAVAIIAFDIWTGLLGHTLTTGMSLWAAFLGQIPFTLYHLSSLIFIPPMVGLGKALVRVRVPVSVAVKTSVKSSQWR